MRKKLITRGLLVLATLNFVACFWFAQYVPEGLPVYAYVVGSFMLWTFALVGAE